MQKGPRNKTGWKQRGREVHMDVLGGIRDGMNARDKTKAMETDGGNKHKFGM